MSNDFIPVNIPALDGDELDLVQECIHTGWVSSEGPFVRQFEEQFSRIVDRRYGIAVSNGSAALDIAVTALELGRGDEVIMPSHTIISCAASIVRAGATPVLVDSHPSTWNMDIDQIEEKINSNTKAIMMVHIFSLPVDVERLKKIANKYNLIIIEDAAQMIGQTYKGEPCGSFGDISTFSFYPNKNITTGEGGMVVTNDSALAERCKSLRNLCFDNKRRFYHEELGWNYRITNLQAALGVAQLKKLGEHVDKKKNMGKLYRQLLCDFDEIELPPDDTEYAENIYWVFGVMLRDHISYTSSEMIAKLGEAGVGARTFFWPMHEQPVFRKKGLFLEEHYPFSEKMARKGFYLPSGLGLSEKQQYEVVDRLKNSFL